METKDWIYIAPQRIRQRSLALPDFRNWADFEALNMQRLARVFEFQSCIAFVGSGASRCLGYPSWTELVPSSQKIPAGAEILEVTGESIGPQQALQIIEQFVKGGKEVVFGHLEEMFVHKMAKSSIDDKIRNLEAQQDYTFDPLVNLPVRRFVTTNYDKEIERALAKKLGPSAWNESKSFEQDDLGKLSIFAVALARENRNMVFHCHGTIDGEISRQKSAKKLRQHRRMVLTDADYNYWYLSSNRKVSSLQLCLDVVLQSNPLFFVGYSISDVDLLRILRRASLRWESERIASNLFVLLNQPQSIENADKDAWRLAQQIRLGVNLLPYDLNDADILSETAKRLDKSAGSLEREAEALARNVATVSGLDSGLIKAANNLTDDISDLASRARTAANTGKAIAEQSHALSNIRYTLAKELGKRERECSRWREKWRAQPKVKPISSGPEGRIVSRGSWQTPVSPFVDCLFNPPCLQSDSFLDKIYTAFKKEGVLVITGPAGAGKLLKACQFVERTKEEYRSLVFHAYNNDDVYGYLKRIGTHIAMSSERMRAALKNAQPGHAVVNSLLIVINNVDLLIGYDPVREWTPRNKAARNFMNRIEIFNYLCGLSSKGPMDPVRVRILLTARGLPKLRKVPDSALKSQHRRHRQILELPLIEPTGISPFTCEEVGLNPDEFRSLAWELRRDPSGLVLAALFVGDLDPSSQKVERADRLAKVLEILRPNSFEMGTRVVRHVIRTLDSANPAQGRNYETLLSFISCFNTPITPTILSATVDCCRRSLIEDAAVDARSEDLDVAAIAKLNEQLASLEFPPEPQERLCALGLLQEIRSNPSGHPGNVDEDEVKFVVHPLVNRFFRQVREPSQQQPESQEFGLHGLLSRGPFNCPITSQAPQKLFKHFARTAYDQYLFLVGLHKSDCDDVQAIEESASQKLAHLIRAMIDILRSNFACNSVPIWGEFRDYIDMLSVTIDLLRNSAAVLDKSWQPGKIDPGPASRSRFETSRPWFNERAIASAEEMLYLYNELGLAYYNSGSVQDALSVWGLAFDWQKAVDRDDRNQGIMYAASLNSHVGMAYMQLGWLQTAYEHFQAAHIGAKATDNADLAWRMEGMLARVEHFRGNSPQARKVYRKVARELGKLGNRRAQSYFTRHLAAVETRLGNFDEATRLARECKALATSQHARDLVAFASEMEGRVYSAAREDTKAIRKFRIALVEAQRLDISRLKADILLGIATVQLRLGDASAARRRAIAVMELANENLLVLRQVKAMVILGKVAAEYGDIQLSQSILSHAKRLAAESQFRLVESDAEEALAELRVGGSSESEIPF